MMNLVSSQHQCAWYRYSTRTYVNSAHRIACPPPGFPHLALMDGKGYQESHSQINGDNHSQGIRFPLRCSSGELTDPCRCLTNSLFICAAVLGLSYQEGSSPQLEEHDLYPDRSRKPGSPPNRLTGWSNCASPSRSYGTHL